MSEARAKVLQTLVGKTRTVFEGLEHEARRYVENNFPRPHVEPGTVTDNPAPDAVLVKEDGSKETYHADNGWSSESASADSGKGNGELA